MAGPVDKSDTTWYVQGGVEKKWFPLGKTNIFGMFRRDDAGANVATNGNFNTQGANVDYWAVGAAQNFEAAEFDPLSRLPTYRWERLSLETPGPIRSFPPYSKSSVGRR